MDGARGYLNQAGIAFVIGPLDEKHLAPFSQVFVAVSVESPTSSNSIEWTQPTRRERRILLVDDTPANQMLARAILVTRGHVVEVAGDGREALELIQRSAFDVVLMDVQMPTMDGLTAVRLIRQLPKALQSEMPIVAMTGHSARQDLRDCLAAGMDACLPKPVDAAQLIKMIETIERRPGGSHSSETGGKRVPSPADISAINIESARARLGGDELVAELARLFLDDAPELLAKIEQAVHAGQLEELNRGAHSLKGLAANFDAEILIVAAIQLEDRSLQADLSKARRLLPELTRAVQEVSAALERYLR